MYRILLLSVVRLMFLALLFESSMRKFFSVRTPKSHRLKLTSMYADPHLAPRFKISEHTLDLKHGVRTVSFHYLFKLQGGFKLLDSIRNHVDSPTSSIAEYKALFQL